MKNKHDLTPSEEFELDVMIKYGINTTMFPIDYPYKKNRLNEIMVYCLNNSDRFNEMFIEFISKAIKKSIDEFIESCDVFQDLMPNGFFKGDNYEN